MKKLLLITLALAILATMVAFNNNKDEKTMKKIPAINIQDMDMTNKPGNNFFKYVNGSWMSENAIPAEYSQYGAFMIRHDRRKTSNSETRTKW